MNYKYYPLLIVLTTFSFSSFSQNKEKENVQAEHGMISNAEAKSPAAIHSQHPDAQWYPDATLGLFLHWGLSSVKNLDASWPMIPGRPLAAKDLDPSEIKRIVQQKDYNLNGKQPAITPNEYWAMAKDFNPTNYDPDKWIKAAKDAGFTYAVLTTRHHEGFAMWPSNYGNFSTKNYMGGRDLVKPFVDACRKYGLKVGLYYSPPDWYFDRVYMNFLYYRGPQRNPGLPVLDADLNPRTTKKSPEEIQKHQAEFAAYVRGQIEEILTRWGKIDVLWFDGKAPVPNGNNLITQEEIRKLQPGIVINPRMHGTGDFVTFERTPPKGDPGNVWAEFCNTWTNSWANSNTQSFRSNAFVLGELVSARAWGVNYLLGVGPTSDGVFPDAVYQNMKVVEEWMKANGSSVKNVKQLPAKEEASVPATANGNVRYLFAIPKFKDNGKYEEDRLPAEDVKITLKTLIKPQTVTLLSSGKQLSYQYNENIASIELPAGLRTNLVDVVKVELELDLRAKDSIAALKTAAILTPKQGPEPRINGPKVFGVRPGNPIVFTIPATGDRPMTFSASDLPKGVKLDAQTGRLSGSIKKAGTYKLTLEARNKSGKATREFKIVVGEKIALTPPMGWNHWNIFGTRISQEKVFAQAQAMVSSGLINHGWTYLNIDDGWQGKRGGEFHAILEDTATFQNMQLLCDQVHAMGLKIGIYSTPWVESYGHHIGGSAMNPEGLFEKTKENISRNKKLLPYAIGTYRFWENDARQFAKWGFDYLKYDWNPIEYPETKAMYDYLRASGRDVVYSLSNSTPFASIAELSTIANAWRTGGDIKDSWKSLKSRIFTQDKWAPFAGPGHWNDPDMMVLGVLGWNTAEKWPSKLTIDEQYTHISAWCLMSVPLLLGNDLTKLDDFTISLLTNDEVLAVNQDPLGKQATVISRDGEDIGVMAKDMEDGSKAAGLFNLADNGTQKVVVKWSDLGICGRYIVRDLWRQQDLGTFENEFSADVNQHGVVMISLRKAK
jgi:alpha-galactosidase